MIDWLGWDLETVLQVSGVAVYGLTVGFVVLMRWMGP